MNSPTEIPSVIFTPEETGTPTEFVEANHPLVRAAPKMLEALIESHWHFVRLSASDAAAWSMAAHLESEIKNAGGQVRE